MKKYVALLRGVNAGGKRRVPQAEFRQVLERLGFHDVVIYINSGNAVFANDHEVVTSDVQVALEAQLGFAIPTLILPAEQVRAIAAAIPSEWTNDAPTPDKSGHKSDVLYLFADVDAPDVIDKIGYKPDIETMVYVEGAVLATISRKNQSKGSLQKMIGSKLYAQVTVRNITTAKKLAELVGE